MRSIGLIAVMSLAGMAAMAQSSNTRPATGTTKPAAIQTQNGDATGQPTPPKPVVVNNVPDVMADMPAPEMRMLSSLMMGHWNHEEKYAPSDANPQGVEMTGMGQMRNGPGGHSVIYESEVTGPRGAVSMIRYLLYDPKTKSVTGFVQNSHSPSVITLNGVWDESGMLLKLAYTEMVDGKKFEYRDIFSGFTKDSFTESLDMRPAMEAKASGSKPGTTEKQPEWKNVMTAKYTRQETRPLLWRPGMGPRPAAAPPAKPPQE